MMTCPYCQRENAPQALVCSTCSRDIAVPDMLIAERLDLIEKRNFAAAKLSLINEKIAAIRLRPRSAR